ncbi:hypothetical protein DPMN_070554 [Dreissena polymorpha]|uniref:Uncharacterized protein n=1 Tax=Dreissena polymorpha TaxID=45954 RepID=A0A9D3Z5M7_DREPO|nr:hypothetical protein DPMN_070554 [Dreissena polymorpha]
MEHSTELYSMVTVATKPEIDDISNLSVMGENEAMPTVELSIIDSLSCDKAKESDGHCIHFCSCAGMMA